MGRQIPSYVTLVRSVAEGQPLELESKGAFLRWKGRWEALSSQGLTWPSLAGLLAQRKVPKKRCFNVRIRYRLEGMARDKYLSANLLSLPICQIL